jgi:SnoaL-like polyketide cyclase
MSQLVARALHLWSEPLPEGAAALALFRTVYTDPLDVNGESTALQVLVDRARMMQCALAGLRHEINERIDAPGRQAFAFRITGRHVGPLETPLGEIAATGRELHVDGMDIFLVDDEADRVIGVWAIADFLGLLMQAGAVEPSARSPT